MCEPTDIYIQQDGKRNRETHMQLRLNKRIQWQTQWVARWTVLTACALCGRAPARSNVTTGCCHCVNFSPAGTALPGMHQTLVGMLWAHEKKAEGQHNYADQHQHCVESLFRDDLKTQQTMGTWWRAHLHEMLTVAAAFPRWILWASPSVNYKRLYTDKCIPHVERIALWLFSSYPTTWAAMCHLWRNGNSKVSPCHQTSKLVWA